VTDAGGGALVPPAPTPRQPALVECRLHPLGVVLDTPLTGPPGTQIHAATLWPESMSPSGWMPRRWDVGPGGRGFIPGMIEPGDVISFGAFRPPPPTPPADGQPSPPGYQLVAEWIGYLYEITAGGLRLVGPYPNPAAAHTAAQLYLFTRQLPAELTRQPVYPAGRPAALTMTWHGPSATVGDPVHGWLTVETARLSAALALTVETLHRELRNRVGGLTGHEPLITLAALAAVHLPDLPDITAAPAATDPTPAADPPAPTAAPASPTAAPETDSPAPDGSQAGPPDPAGDPGSEPKPADAPPGAQPEPAGIDPPSEPPDPPPPDPALDGP
jgi:hypothetical protein